MRFFRWVGRWPLWVKIVVPIALVLLILAGLVLNIYLTTRRALDQMLSTGDIGTISEEVVQTSEEYQGDYLNFLVVGIDYDEDDVLRDYGSSDQAMTDVILYIHYNIKQNTLSVLQIPRDSYIGDISPTGKINKVFASGTDKENHINNLARLINTDFGLPVDNYITLDMAAFKEIIDTFGGLDVYLPWDIFVYDDNGEQSLLAPAGNTRVSGDTAEMIVRARKQYAEGDLKRLELQQYIYAAMYKLVKSASLGDMYNYVLPIVSYRVKSDLEYNTMVQLCSNVLKLDSSSIFFVRAPGGSLNVNGQSVYGIDAAALLPTLNTYFLADDQKKLTLKDLEIPTGFEYSLGEILDEGHYLSDLLEESDGSPEADTANTAETTSSASQSPAA